MRRALTAVMLWLAVTSCRHSSELRVRVLYSAQNPVLLKLRQAEREFSFTDARLHSGKPFLVSGLTYNNPAQVLADSSKAKELDMIVLHSASELPDNPDLRKEVGESFTVCQQSVAYIPEWVNEERHEGAARFLQYLSTHCR